MQSVRQAVAESVKRHFEIDVTRQVEQATRPVTRARSAYVWACRELSLGTYGEIAADMHIHASAAHRMHGTARRYYAAETLYRTVLDGIVREQVEAA